MGALPLISRSRLLHCRAMDRLPEIDRRQLVQDIASRAGTAAQIASWYDTTPEDLRAFVEIHRAEIEQARNDIDSSKVEQQTNSEPDPTELSDLWITNKFQRLKRLQELAEIQYRDVVQGSLEGAELSTGLREFRSYLALAANELGQLLHRGAGDAGSGDTVSYDIAGVDMDTLK